MAAPRKKTAPLPVPYWVRLKQLREAAGLSQPELYRDSGVSFGTIRALETPYRPRTTGQQDRSRYPSPGALEKLSAALGVEPEEFPEYRLAKARELLDERQVGLEEALTHLDRITEALRQSAQRSATAAAQRAARRRKLQATPDEEQSQGGGD